MKEMKTKEIEKLLKNEGNAMFSTSFDGVLNKLMQNQKYINRPREENTNNKKTKISLATKVACVLSTISVAGIVCAVVIPVTMNNSNIAPSADTLCDLELNDPRNGQVLQLAYDVNTKGLVNISSIYAKNELGKKVLAGMKHDNFSSSNHVDKFTVNLIKYVFTTPDKHSSFLMDPESLNFCVIRTKGPGAGDSEFNTKLQNRISETLAKEISAQKFSVSVLGDSETYGNLINDMLLARKSEIYFFIEKMFGIEHEIIEGYEPSSEYLRNLSLDDAVECLNILRELYSHIPLDENLDDFKMDLDSIEAIFEGRRTNLLEGMSLLYNAVKKIGNNTQKNQIEIAKNGFNEEDLLSPFWWEKDQFSNEELNNLAKLNIPNDIYEQAYMFIENNDIIQTNVKEAADNFIENYTLSINLLKKNQMFFARAFDYIKDRSLINNLASSYKEDTELSISLPFSNKNYWDDTGNYWSDYWKK